MTRHVLIAGPTASGKSALAMRLAEQMGATIVNADALQVYDCWQVLTARPSAEETARLPHRLYGHIGAAQDYSVGAWLREVAELLATDAPLVIVGGTGLYFSSLVGGLAEIPPIPPEVRAAGDALRLDGGAAALLAALRPLDPAILQRIDTRNPARLQRAWEVATATGRPLSDWQDASPDPVLPLAETWPICLDSDPAWLNDRIARRFDIMLDQGALEECQAVLARGWNRDLPSGKALGAAQLIDHLQGRLSLHDAVALSCIASRQYAKRQRTWFRSRMGHWHRYRIDQTAADEIASSVLRSMSVSR